MKFNRLCHRGAVSLLFAALSLTAAAQVLPELPTLTPASLSLKDALRIASANNLTLTQAQADADSASAAARSAQAQTKPSLSTTTYVATGDSANILTTSPGVLPQNIFTVSPHGFADQNLMLMVPLSTGGRLQNAVTVARKQGEAAQLSVEASRLTVTETVTEDYATALLQQSLVEVAQSRLTAEEEQVRVTQEKASAGRSAPVDLRREQAEQADARQALLAAQNGAALALITLKTALGVSQASNVTLSDTLDGLSELAQPLPATLQDALIQAEANRPELASAQKQIDAAQAGISGAKSAYAPQVYGIAMGDATAGQGSGRAGYTFGLTASLPLFDGGQRQAETETRTGDSASDPTVGRSAGGIRVAYDSNGDRPGAGSDDRSHRRAGILQPGEPALQCRQVRDRRAVGLTFCPDSRTRNTGPSESRACDRPRHSPSCSWRINVREIPFDLETLERVAPIIRNATHPTRLRILKDRGVLSARRDGNSILSPSGPEITHTAVLNDQCCANNRATSLRHYIRGSLKPVNLTTPPAKAMPFYLTCAASMSSRQDSLMTAPVCDTQRRLRKDLCSGLSDWCQINEH